MLSSMVLLHSAAAEPHVGTQQLPRAQLHKCHVSSTHGPPRRWILYTGMCQGHLSAQEEEWARERKKESVPKMNQRSSITARNLKNKSFICLIHSYIHSFRKIFLFFFPSSSFSFCRHLALADTDSKPYMRTHTHIYTHTQPLQTGSGALACPHSPSWDTPPPSTSLPNTANTAPPPPNTNRKS